MLNLKAPRRDFALVAAAGPASNLVLAVSAAVIMEVSGIQPQVAGGAFFGRLLTLMIFMNVLLAVFNMIPVPPLDGGNVLAGLAPEPVGRVIDQLRPYGIFILYALLLTGAFQTIVYPVQDFVLSWLL